MPALFAVMFLGLQAALVYHARTLALAAAQEGARAAGAERSSVAAGASSARSFLDDTAGDALSATTVSARRTATTSTVTITGRALSVIPGWQPHVTQSASVPVERITS
ncbi:TadE/TadG family type IV pilus assembly protein [Arthrobacter sp. NEB 688]|uniref:TadE/TadG family type IV pilus assembly protein n=1 Tax=Arthrobacter sp. NEB 688 TaxID=904039 RepID=UPI0025701216|nr:TadE/TadG family type IV pilus assembly protein [Arthrobacter sp. NEB 688]